VKSAKCWAAGRLPCSPAPCSPAPCSTAQLLNFGGDAWRYANCGLTWVSGRLAAAAGSCAGKGWKGLTRCKLCSRLCTGQRNSVKKRKEEGGAGKMEEVSPSKCRQGRGTSGTWATNVVDGEWRALRLLDIGCWLSEAWQGGRWEGVF
jgi:hypothetical protein